MELRQCKVVPAQINTGRTLTRLACGYRGHELEKGTLGVANQGRFGAHSFVPATFFFSEIPPQTNLSTSIPRELSAFTTMPYFSNSYSTSLGRAKVASLAFFSSLPLQSKREASSLEIVSFAIPETLYKI